LAVFTAAKNGLEQTDCQKQLNSTAAIVLAREGKGCSILRARPAAPPAGGTVMDKKILVALENSRADQALLPHVAGLAGHCQARLVLLHVADGWVARNFERMKLAESEEMKEDRAYLEKNAAELREQGLEVETQLALGEPSTEILRAAREAGCDLIAMTTHGHRFIGDLVFGSTIHEVRHKSLIPILLVRATLK
jgi:manganese transport protein